MLLLTLAISGAIIGTLLISTGHETFRWLATGPVTGGIMLPPMPGLSGLIPGVVIVAVMVFLPTGITGITGNREVKQVFHKR